MTHDEGVHWLADQLRPKLETLYADARTRYMAADSGLEEEYWRGTSEAAGDVLALLEELAPEG